MPFLFFLSHYLLHIKIPTNLTKLMDFINEKFLNSFIHKILQINLCISDAFVAIRQDVGISMKCLFIWCLFGFHTLFVHIIVSDVMNNQTNNKCVTATDYSVVFRFFNNDSTTIPVFTIDKVFLFFGRKSYIYFICRIELHSTAKTCSLCLVIYWIKISHTGLCMCCVCFVM